MMKYRIIVYDGAGKEISSVPADDDPDEALDTYAELQAKHVHIRCMDASPDDILTLKDRAKARGLTLKLAT